MSTMKKVISSLSLLSFLICFSISNLQAQDPGESILKKKMDTYMSYPYLAEKNMDGEVAVSFSVTQKGKLNILKIDSSNSLLIPYVLRRLNKINLPLDDAKIGTTQSYKFNFTKEEGRNDII